MRHATDAGCAGNFGRREQPRRRWPRHAHDGTHANVTERKQLERALSNTLRVLRALLETLPLPVIPA